MKALALFACTLFLYSCAYTPQSEQIRSDGITSLPQKTELTDTPFFPQTEHQCGPAALATILRSHGVEVTPDQLSKEIYLPERQGSLQIEISVASRRHDMLPYPIDPRLNDLFTEVAAGNPVLVMQNLSFAWAPQWHYAVVVGYDLESHEVILRSGTNKRWTTPVDVFERTWQRADHWALAIVPVGDIPAKAVPEIYLKTAYAFEETRNTITAYEAYQAATKRWLDSSVTWLTFGNLAYANEEWKQAVDAFYNAVSIDPESISGWNNLAYALNAIGCIEQAQSSIKCGLVIKPDDANLNASQRELTVKSEPDSNVICPVINCKPPL